MRSGIFPTASIISAACSSSPLPACSCPTLARAGAAAARTAKIRLNWRLLQAHRHVIDYVVAHEVAHLRVLSHSTRFWRLVERLYPDYESAKAELSAMSHHYMAL